MKETRISNLQLASFLIALDHRLLRVEGTQGRREFVFVEVPREVIIGYYGDRDRVSARRLFNAYRDLRGLARQAL